MLLHFQNAQELGNIFHSYNDYILPCLEFRQLYEVGHTYVLALIKNITEDA